MLIHFCELNLLSKYEFSFLVCKCALVMLQVGEGEVFLSSEITLVDLILNYYDLSDLALLF